jgi:hypothetical protein
MAILNALNFPFHPINLKSTAQVLFLFTRNEDKPDYFGISIEKKIDDPLRNYCLFCGNLLSYRARIFEVCYHVLELDSFP